MALPLLDTMPVLLSYIDARTLGTVAQLSRDFARWISQPTVWQQLISGRFPTLINYKPESYTWPQYAIELESVNRPADEVILTVQFWYADSRYESDMKSDPVPAPAQDPAPARYRVLGRTKPTVPVAPRRSGRALHRIGDLPAVIYADKRREWYFQGKLHREGGQPAVVGPLHRKWYRHGGIHRDQDQPAFIGQDGSLLWYVNGQRHRDNDLPAGVFPNGYQEWYQFGRRHRVHGPAVIYTNRQVEWWIEGQRVPGPACLPPM
jgi:hypothetical protein